MYYFRCQRVIEILSKLSDPEIQSKEKIPSTDLTETRETLTPAEPETRETSTPAETETIETLTTTETETKETSTPPETEARETSTPAETETSPAKSSVETTGFTEPHQKKLQESILLFVSSLEEERKNLCKLEKTEKIQVPSLIIFYIFACFYL